MEEFWSIGADHGDDVTTIGHPVLRAGARRWVVQPGLRPIAVVVSVVMLAAGIGVGLAGAASASAASKKRAFCAAVSDAGGSTAFAQVASSGSGASALESSVKSLEKVAPSKKVKSELKTMRRVFSRAANGASVGDLGAKDVAALDAAISKFDSYVDGSCTAASGSSTTAATAAGALSGTWAGQYSGASEGTFSLTWQQSGDTLSGTIEISDLDNNPIPINGTISGSKISFGTVGSLAITYSGSVSGTTMSGTYRAPTGTGDWNATKSS
jgi:hypothetical protein